MLFGCPRLIIIAQRSQRWFIKSVFCCCCCCFIIINHQVKTSALNNVKKLVKQTVQALIPGRWLLIINNYWMRFL